VRAVSRGIDRLGVIFDDESLVANAGLVLPATLMVRLGVEALVNAVVRVGSRPGRKVCSLVAAMLVGASHIDHADVLRAGATERVLPFRVMAPSTLGTFLRSFTFGHVRQLDRVLGEALRRAWAAGAGPGAEALTIDVDSTICEVRSLHKQGATRTYARKVGYHPLLATRADTGEVLHARMRKGAANTQRGAASFIAELVGRVRRAGATGELLLRADSGFHSQAVISACERHDLRYSITIRLYPAWRAVIDAIDDASWTTLLDYPAPGVAQVAETVYDGRRLIVRRTHHPDQQGELFVNWDYHAFLTDRPGDIVTLDREHRQHAVVELAIRDLKANALAHCPSGKFAANAAWLACAVLAHNLVRWTTHLGGIRDHDQLTVAATIRSRHLAVPGRLVNRSGRHQLRLPARWPSATAFVRALTHLRAIRLLN
jgi:hypothetical protein